MSSASNEFVEAYQAHKVGNVDYSELISMLFEAFKVTAEVTGLDLHRELEAMQENLERSLAGLQKAHRDFLIKLSRLS